MGLDAPLLPGASPGLLRRRYSLPETVMRKYKLAQHKSETDESEICSAPSPRIPSPARSSRGRERGPRSTLLRRIWGRDPPTAFGGSHSELRYWDSHSGSSSPDRGGCDACKKLSAKIDVPIYSRSYASQILLSPKRQRLKCGTTHHHHHLHHIHPGSERFESVAIGSSPERSSLKSTSDSSSKLGLSSLATSSYPVTDAISEISMTRSSASFTSDDMSRSQSGSNPSSLRPKTASDSLKLSPSHRKKRRQSYCDSADSNNLDTKLDLRVESAVKSATSQEADNNYTFTSSDISKEFSSSTTTTTTTTTSESQHSTAVASTTTTRRDTSSPSDSAMSTHTDKSDDKDVRSDRSNLSTAESKNSIKKNNPDSNRDAAAELSDTGISGMVDTDSNKHTDSSQTEEDFSNDQITCVETLSINAPSFECLEVVVSETMNSQAFESIDVNSNRTTSRSMTNKIDIDQYVSNILIDSLNTMTDQINEINSNINDDDLKVNILEKEIKVKLKSVHASPINLSTLITSIPDRELLETTIIEEKSRSLAYTTETKLFPVDKSSIIVDKPTNITVTIQEEDSSPPNNNDFYIDYENTDTPLPYDVNKNEDTNSNEIKTKAVLEQLHRIFENNNVQRLDSNFNVCIDSQPTTFFCGTTNNGMSHMEMSTDVDVFVDNSLNKMMNSIDINYNENGIEELVFEKLNLNDEEHLNKKNPEEKQYDVIGNIGAGSLYQKPAQLPVVVPRFSAMPHSDSMEVNTSSEDEDGCQSDCMSLVDSLDDPKSPRPFMPGDKRVLKRTNKYDKRLVRGGIISLLPENATVAPIEVKSPREKSETFFVPIKEDCDDISAKENIVVAEHMPEKIKERLYKRQQKRELRKEHLRRRKMKQLKREMENKQKKVDAKKTDDESVNENPVVATDKLKSDKNNETLKKERRNPNVKRPPPPFKSERSKPDDVLKNAETFVIDKRGNYQMITAKKKNETIQKQITSALNKNVTVEDTDLYVHNEVSNEIESIDKVKVIKSNRDPEKLCSNAPRRLYQKTEFQDGNKHIEILEIVECVESSPEPPSDDSQASSPSSSSKRHNSKIPVPQKTPKTKGVHKSNRTIRSPLSSSTPEKTPNSKTDQLIANILIDAFNQDNIENKNIHLILSPRDKKTSNSTSKKPEQQQHYSKRMSPIQPKASTISTSKYTRKFDAIPEEKSNTSNESLKDDLLNLIPNASPAMEEAKSCQTTKNKSPKTVSTKSSPESNVPTNSPQEEKQAPISPVTKYTSTATSPIPPQLFVTPKKTKDTVKSPTIGTKEGWNGFCRPQTRCSPENEGSHPSSNNPSDREAIGKTRAKRTPSESSSTAPSSQRALRTMDSRNNIDRHSDETKNNGDHKTAENGALVQNKRKNYKSQKGKLSKMPTESFSRSSDVSSTSINDSDDSEVNCPVLVPRWPPIVGPRHKRYTKKPQRQDDAVRMPFQNVAGGWSVTLAGSCYTALPSDVEMKVCFPKSSQQPTSQSDSGLGEEHHNKSKKQHGVCRKCGNCDTVCKKCKTVQDCQCAVATAKKRQEKIVNDENEPFLPSAQQSRINSSTEALAKKMDPSKKYFNYLPDVNSDSAKRNPKQATLKMARRFSLHCWLPESRAYDKTNVTKMQITETITPYNEEELSVFGCAIMPEIKPRVPTMSERDLTRVHATQYYSRHRHV